MKFSLGLAAIFVTIAAAFSLSACTANQPEPYGTAMTRSQGLFAGTQVEVAQQTGTATSCGATPPQIDTRLQAGQAFETTYGSINGQTSRVISVRARILTVAATKLEERVLPLSVNGINGVDMTAEQPLICSYDSSNTGSCALPPIVTQAQSGATGDYRDCHITGAGSDAVEKIAFAGTFTFTDGQKFSASKFVMRTKGILWCDNRQIGDGEKLETLITSPDVPAEGQTSNCGGTILFHSVILKNRMGRVMMGDSTERTSAP